MKPNIMRTQISSLVSKATKILLLGSLCVQNKKSLSCGHMAQLSKGIPDCATQYLREKEIFRCSKLFEKYQQ